MGLLVTKRATTVQCALGSWSACLASSVIHSEVNPFKCTKAFKRASHRFIHRAGGGLLTAVCSALAPFAPFGIGASWLKTAVCTQGMPVPEPTLPVLLYRAEDIPETYSVEASLHCLWGPQ